MKTDKAAYTSPSLLPESRLKLALIPFREGERIENHDDLAPLLRQGWVVKSVAPRVVEGEGLKFLVVLHRPRLKRAAPPVMPKPVASQAA